jgi:hypothetical protein
MRTETRFRRSHPHRASISSQTQERPNPLPANPQTSQASLPVPVSPRISQSEGQAPQVSTRRVAIPRLKKRGGEEVAEGERKSGRVSHACEPCRQRKTKCSGERPTCTRCKDIDVVCFYADGKRDRLKKYVTVLSLTDADSLMSNRQFGSATETAEKYRTVLRDLIARVGSEEAELIRKTLEEVCLFSCQWN